MISARVFSISYSAVSPSGDITQERETESSDYTMDGQKMPGPDPSKTKNTAGYLLRFFSGSAFGAPKEVALGQVVQPGGEIDITIAMKAPATPGSYLTDWVLADQNRTNFKEPVYLKIKVAVPGTATATAKP